MTAKEYLSQAYRIDQRINSKLEQISALRELLNKTSNVLSDMTGNPNKDRSRVEDYVVKIVDMEKELDEDIDRLISLKADIMHTIKKVEDAECQMLLEDRYLRFLTWEAIADNMGYTVRNVYILHGKALGMIKI